MDKPSGLAPATRYRCSACGNLTRFDVVTSERVRRFWHFDLSGAGVAEEEERSEVTVLSVGCRWCGAAHDVIEIVDVPGAAGQPHAVGQVVGRGE
ncbi:MAG: hypothetical protein GEU81_01980 [Nitriliruptorales bacterium]|nr:hypothetical protein [Nitriliruptorales bacterium]